LTDTWLAYLPETSGLSNELFDIFEYFNRDRGLLIQKDMKGFASLSRAVVFEALQAFCVVSTRC